jgi:negative regulator of replication initiation
LLFTQNFKQLFITDSSSFLKPTEKYYGGFEIYFSSNQLTQILRGKTGYKK